MRKFLASMLLPIILMTCEPTLAPAQVGDNKPIIYIVNVLWMDNGDVLHGVIQASECNAEAARLPKIGAKVIAADEDGNPLILTVKDAQFKCLTFTRAENT